MQGNAIRDQPSPRPEPGGTDDHAPVLPPVSTAARQTADADRTAGADWPATGAEPSWAGVLGTTLRLWLSRLLATWRRAAGSPARRWRRTAGFLVLAAVIFAGGAVTVLLSQSTRVTGDGTAAAKGAASAGGIGSSAVARAAAATWVEQHVSRAAIVGCDPMMCVALQAGGFPSADLLPLTSAMAAPLGSTVIVATAAVRSQFGPRLASVYAPMVLASFGSGAARVDIRVYAPGSAARYRAALAADMAERRIAGRQLLANSRSAASGAARLDLTAGKVDSRLLVTLSALTSRHNLSIVAFGDAAPGGEAEMPMLSAELAVPRGIRHPGKYLQSLLVFLRAQRPPFLASGTRVAGASATAVLQVAFSAPAPLGLLGQRASS